MNTSPFYSEHPMVEAPPDWKAEYQKLAEKMALCRAENERLREKAEGDRAKIDSIHVTLSERPTPDKTTQAVELQELHMKLDLLIAENAYLQEIVKVACKYYPAIRKIIDKENKR